MNRGSAGSSLLHTWNKSNCRLNLTYWRSRHWHQTALMVTPFSSLAQTPGSHTPVSHTSGMQTVLNEREKSINFILDYILIACVRKWERHLGLPVILWREKQPERKQLLELPAKLAVFNLTPDQFCSISYNLWLFRLRYLTETLSKMNKTSLLVQGKQLVNEKKICNLR